MAKKEPRFVQLDSRGDERQTDEIVAEVAAPTTTDSTPTINYTINESYYTLPIPLTQDDLRERFCVKMLRSPRRERCLFRNALYIGVAVIINTRFKVNYNAHIWLVQFMAVNWAKYDSPVNGLMEVRIDRWAKYWQQDPATALTGVCAITADKRGNIKSIEVGLEEIDR